MGQAAVFRTSFSPAKAGAQTCEYLTHVDGVRVTREKTPRPPSSRCCGREREGTFPATAPNAAAPERKRGPALLPGPVSPDCCRGPGRIFGMVSAAPPLAPARACELRVGRRGWPFSTHPEGELRLPAPAARFVSPAGGRKSEALLDAFLRSILPGPSASLARCFRLADLPAVRFPVPEAGHLRTRFHEPGHRPFPSRPSRFEQHLRAAFCFQSSRAPPSLETSAAPGRHFGFATCRNFASPNRSQCGFPKAPAPFPARVSF